MKETERKDFDNIKDTANHDQWILEDILGSRKMGEGAQLTVWGTVWESGSLFRACQRQG